MKWKKGKKEKTVKYERFGKEKRKVQPNKQALMKYGRKIHKVSVEIR